jgi:molybdopterin converting factor subunit 1
VFTQGRLRSTAHAATKHGGADFNLPRHSARAISLAMRVTVLYFAQLRERRGAATDELELPMDGDVAMAMAMIAKSHPHVAPQLPRVQVAVNQVIVAATTALHDGDELALIPPVSGGAPLRIAVADRPLQLDHVIEAVVGPERGGLVTFTGMVRRQGRIPDVVRLEYEAYRAMAEKVLGEIADEIEHEIAGTRIAIHHRVGSLAVGDAAVIVAAAAPHRAQAFDACRAAIDRLKQRAPIWKKEIGDSGATWIDHCC